MAPTTLRKAPRWVFPPKNEEKSAFPSWKRIQPGGSMSAGFSLPGKPRGEQRGERIPGKIPTAKSFFPKLDFFRDIPKDKSLKSFKHLDFPLFFFSPPFPAGGGKQKPTQITGIKPLEISGNATLSSLPGGFATALKQPPRSPLWGRISGGERRSQP